MNQPDAKPTQPEAAPAEPITLDCDQVLTHAGGDPELLIQLCTIFLSELPLNMESLRSAILQRNHLATQRALLRMRTGLTIFGSGQVSPTAQRLEHAVRDRRLRQIRHEWKRLESQLQLLVPQVQRLMLEMATPRSAVQ